MNNTVNTTTTGTTGTTYTAANTCGNKLPCGYCLLLNRPCPMQSNTFVTPTWDPNWYKITCQQEGPNG